MEMLIYKLLDRHRSPTKVA